MKIIRITQDLRIEEIEFVPKHTSADNDFFCDLIGCDIYERVKPRLLYSQYGIEVMPKADKHGLSVSMLVDGNGLYNDSLYMNYVGSYLYGTFEHGSPIVGNILFVGETFNRDGINFEGIDDEVEKYLFGEFKQLIDKVLKG